MNSKRSFGLRSLAFGAVLFGILGLNDGLHRYGLLTLIAVGAMILGSFSLGDSRP